MESRIKLYCDASFDKTIYPHTNLSIVIFNGNDLIYKHCIPNTKAKNSFEAEFYAIKESVSIVKKLNLKQLTIHSDGKGNVVSLNFKAPKKYKKIVNEIKNISQGLDIIFEWVPRSENTFADQLAKERR